MIWLRCDFILQILRAAAQALKKQDFQMALEMSSYVYATNPSYQRALDIRTDAILALASRQVSANARNYFLTCVAEDQGVHPQRYQTTHTIKAMPLNTVLTKMQFCVNPDTASKLSIKACMTVTDLHETYTLTLRNSILEVCKLIYPGLVINQ